MDEKKIRKIIDGLSGSRYADLDLKRIEAICSVVPLDYPVTLSVFYSDQIAASAEAFDLFMQFLVETGKEFSVCDDSPIDPIMMYERPDSEHSDHIYTADGCFFDEGICYDGTWGEMIDPAGFWMQNGYIEHAQALTDAMWELCNGNPSVLLKRLNEHRGSLRRYWQEPDELDCCSTFEDEWEWPTWKAWRSWCKKKGIKTDPFEEIMDYESLKDDYVALNHAK